MMNVIRSRWAQRRQQSGYVLLLVLVASGLFALIVLALLGMVGTDAKASKAYFKSDEVKRAVDGALQIGIGEIKTVKGTDLSPTDPCKGFTNRTVEIEKAAGVRPVALSCADATTAAPEAIPSAGDGKAALTVARQWDPTALTAPNVGTNTSAEQWAAFLTALGISTTNSPGVINLNNEPLRVYGSVNVRQWSAVHALRPIAAGGMVVAGGTYQEGLSENWACGLHEFVLGLFDPQRTLRVSTPDVPTGPKCGVGQDSAVPAAIPPSVSPPSPAPPSPTPQTVPGIVPTCVPGGVVAFSEGAYDKAQIDQMNLMLTSGGCDNVTFWFQPGNYYFNAAPNYTVGSLYFNNSTSNVVFGAWPRGFASGTKLPANAFPEACDRSAQGVSIVLGPTTSIAHGNGAVAICGRTNGAANPEPIPAISQLAAAALPDVKWASEPETSAAAFGSIPPPGVANVTGGENAAASVSNDVPLFYNPAPPATPPAGKAYDGSDGVTPKTADFSCQFFCARSFIFKNWASPLSPGSSRPLTSAVMQIRASTSNASPDAKVDTSVWPWVLTKPSQTSVEYSRPGTGVLCTATWPVPKLGWGSFPVDNMSKPFAMDLFAAGDCKSVIRTQQDIENGVFEVYFVLNSNPCCGTTLSMKLDAVWIETSSSQPMSPDPTMSLQIDAASNRTFNVFGRVYLPHTQIDLKWWGPRSPLPTYELPIFVGDVTAASVFSAGPNDDPRHVGTLASRSLQVASRRVRLRASIDNHVLASTVVSLIDRTPGTQTLTPAAQLTTEDWNYCNVPLTPTATC